MYSCLLLLLLCSSAFGQSSTREQLLMICDELTSELAILRQSENVNESLISNLSQQTEDLRQKLNDSESRVEALRLSLSNLQATIETLGEELVRYKQLAAHFQRLAEEELRAITGLKDSLAELEKSRRRWRRRAIVGSAVGVGIGFFLARLIQG